MTGSALHAAGAGRAPRGRIGRALSLTLPVCPAPRAANGRRPRAPACSTTPHGSARPVRGDVLAAGGGRVHAGAGRSQDALDLVESVVRRGAVRPCRWRSCPTCRASRGWPCDGPAATAVAACTCCSRHRRRGGAGRRARRGAALRRLERAVPGPAPPPPASPSTSTAGRPAAPGGAAGHAARPGGPWTPDRAARRCSSRRSSWPRPGRSARRPCGPGATRCRRCSCRERRRSSRR